MVRESRVQKKQKRRKIFLRIVSILILVSALGVWAINTSLFGVKTISVKGTNILGNHEIISTSDIKLGDNIILISKGKAIEKIEKNSYVKNVKLSKKLPAKIEIEIYERKPYMQVEYKDNIGILDKEGILLEYNQNKLLDIGFIQGFEWSYVNPGESVFLGESQDKFSDFFNDDELDIVVSKLKKIVYDKEDNIKIDLDSGIEVEFGDLVDVKYKLRMLEEIIIDIETKNIKVSKIIMNKGEYPVVVRDEKWGWLNENKRGNSSIAFCLYDTRVDIINSV